MHEIRFGFEIRESGRGEPILDMRQVRNRFGAVDCRYLGSGAYGETWWIGTDAGEFAVKIIKDPSYPRNRLKREIEGIRRVQCTNVVQLVGADTIEIEGRAHPYLLFEYIDGGNVTKHIVSEHWPDWQELRAFACGLLRGVCAIHAKNTVHRDIKADNVILRGGDYFEPVIVDFGLAKITDFPELTQYPAWLGTAPFMAPEQIRGEKARKGSDLWSVGVLLYILAGREHPFFGSKERLDIDEALDRVLSGPKPLPEEAPDDLAQVITRLLKPEPYQRGSAQRALKDLQGGDEYAYC